MRTKKTLYNTSVMMRYQVVTIICGLILPQVILQPFGFAYNGVLSSITQFLSIVSILWLGISGATWVKLYKSMATNDVARTSGIVLATENYIWKIATVIAIYIVVLASTFPYIMNASFGKADVVALVTMWLFMKGFSCASWIVYAIRVCFVVLVVTTVLYAVSLHKETLYFIDKLKSRIIRGNTLQIIYRRTAELCDNAFCYAGGVA